MKVDVSMKLVPITVMDAKDQPVTNLSPSSFRVFEDNVEQKVVSFHREEGPVSVGFIFDASGSMKNRMDRSIAAIQQFLKDFDWGDLDYLVVDLPPGTGDAPLSLSQLIPLSGVVIVTTGQGGQITFALDNPDQQLRRWREIYDVGRRMNKTIASLDLAVGNNVPVRWMEVSIATPVAPKNLNPKNLRRKNV